MVIPLKLTHIGKCVHFGGNPSLCDSYRTLGMKSFAFDKTSLGMIFGSGK